MIKRYIYILSLSLALFGMVGIWSCGSESGGGRTVSKELNMDTLFLGMTFGMTKQDFLDTVARYDRVGIIDRDSLEGVIIYNTNEGELNYPATVVYYPEFVNDKISAMDMSFRYDQWAKWNEKYWSESLIEDVKKLMASWYGGGFVGKKDVFGNIRYVKKDDPRVITLQIENDEVVNVRIENKTLLRAEEK